MERLGKGSMRGVWSACEVAVNESADKQLELLRVEALLHARASGHPRIV